jgi:hypothetical protein
VSITLQQIQERQQELAALIAGFEAQAARGRVITIDGAEIELQPGEQYAGAVLDAEGQHKHHLVLMAAVPDGDLNWADAKAWAEKVGGSLPDRQEQALLYANCKPHLKAQWHWSSEAHATDASYAWLCDFDGGSQGYGRKSYEGHARAVRLIPLAA